MGTWQHSARRVSLLAASALIAPSLLIAPAVIAGWGLWLRQRVGGMTGDCLGAGVEVSEVVLLLVVGFVHPAGLAVAASWR
ncbi:MAG TPA: adenosylcobinamide-GDP ribazoletransferase [Steroidobacteraceae bacterium]|nr:adenosylcobinamide-GDP ribazoletransferase [Steroidobacteraceae bacterium]